MKFMHTTHDEVDITRNRYWDAYTVQRACIRNDLYTNGSSKDFSNMLNLTNRTEPTTKSLYLIAKNIMDHSDMQTITNIMYILEKEAVITTFEIDGNDMI